MRRQCVGLNRHGEPCKGFVVRGTDPPKCQRHLVGIDAFKEQARRGEQLLWTAPECQPAE